ncbi:hypothetical protein SDC9_150313 [bioreactor metagenome]|uniref:Uncharacterized protein n=1 Tax=bioreactor metagenome TaxID=1076179 RepID=A0A645EP10_9ZZZZ
MVTFGNPPARHLRRKQDDQMKFFLLTGALAGFVTGLLCGLVAHRDGPTVLLEASVAAVVFGLLTRWWGSIWASGLRDSVAQRMAEAELHRKEAKQGRPAKT